MAYLKQRGNAIYAVWKQNGKKVVANTGFKGKTAKIRAKALERAQVMERVAKGLITVEQGVNAVVAAAEAAGIVEQKPTIAEFYEEHEKRHFIGKDPRNFRTARKRFIDFLGEDAMRPMDALTSEKCREFLAKQNQRVRPNTVQAYRILLNTPYHLAWKDGTLRRNPWVTAPAKRHRGVERKRFTRDEVRLIMRNVGFPWRQLIILDIMTSGQRIGDLVNMKWSQIDMKERIIRITTQKTKAPLEIPMTKFGYKVICELKEISGESEYLFPALHQRYTRSHGSISTDFVNMLQSMGFKTHENVELTGDRRRVAIRCFHSFRHTVVSELQNNPLYTETYAEKLVGQSKIVSKSYHSLLEEEKLQGIDFLEQTLLRNKKPAPTKES